MADILIRVKVYCTCGWPLEEVVSSKSTGLGWFTVKPCPNCSAERTQKMEKPKRNPNDPYRDNEESSGPLGAYRRGD